MRRRSPSATMNEPCPPGGMIRSSRMVPPIVIPVGQQAFSGPVGKARKTVVVGLEGDEIRRQFASDNQFFEKRFTLLGNTEILAGWPGIGFLPGVTEQTGILQA